MSNRLKSWEIHPKACRIIPAEKTLNNTANKAAVKWCGPYKYANQIGWWIFPPVDMNVVWKGGKEFEFDLLEEYSDEDAKLVHSLFKSHENVDTSIWCPKSGRTKFTWGAVEDGVMQLWTGRIFKTPPGWCLHVRSPVNFEKQSFHIMEGILETDWMQYDIWLNIVFDERNRNVEFRKDIWPPIAQIIPMRRESYNEEWDIESKNLNRDDEESNQVFEYWVQYNIKKFSGGKQFLTEDGSHKKDATTYHRERKRCLNGNEPIEEELSKKCPFAKKPRLFKYKKTSPK